MKKCLKVFNVSDISLFSLLSLWNYRFKKLKGVHIAISYEACLGGLVQWLLQWAAWKLFSIAPLCGAWLRSGNKHCSGRMLTLFSSHSLFHYSTVSTDVLQNWCLNGLVINDLGLFVFVVNVILSLSLLPDFLLIISACAVRGKLMRSHFSSLCFR